MKEKFRKAFWKADIMQLKNLGGPSDEYDGEADMAFEIIESTDSFDQIKLKLLSIFNIWFLRIYIKGDDISPKFELINDQESIEEAEQIFNSQDKITWLAIMILGFFKNV